MKFDGSLLTIEMQPDVYVPGNWIPLIKNRKLKSFERLESKRIMEPEQSEFFYLIFLNQIYFIWRWRNFVFGQKHFSTKLSFREKFCGHFKLVFQVKFFW